MGNMNFQDEHSEKPEQKGPVSSDENNPEEPKAEDIFVDEPTSGSKFLWVAIVVIVLAGIGGGLYLLNNYGYLKFGPKKPAPTAVTTSTSTPAASATETSIEVPSAPAVKETAKRPDKFALQVSAFRTKSQADRYVQKLKKQGINAYLSAEEVRKDGRWFKVCVGSFDTKLRAIAAIEEMKKKVGTDVWVVPAQ